MMSTAEFQTRKLNIIHALVAVENEQVISAIEALLSGEEDFWTKLSEAQKIRIEAAIRAMDAGEGIPHEVVMKSFREQ